MKKLYFILFILLNQLAFAQGNLQFNQVKLVTALETVPAGKVWKIESVIYNIPSEMSSYQTSQSLSCGVNTFQNFAIEVAGVATKTGQGVNALQLSNITYTQGYTELPIWLPGGATLSGGPCLNKVSILEFNIIP
jgi:hypothetical protein